MKENNPDKEIVDMWAHRSLIMRCKTCMWFNPKAEFKLGRCRRRSPTLGGWPAVYENDWCGDHKLDETKLEEVMVGNNT